MIPNSLSLSLFVCFPHVCCTTVTLRSPQKDRARQLLNNLFTNETDLLVKESVLSRQIYLTMYNSQLPPDARHQRSMLVSGLRGVFERHAAVELDTPIINTFKSTSKVCSDKAE